VNKGSLRRQHFSKEAHTRVESPCYHEGDQRRKSSRQSLYWPPVSKNSWFIRKRVPRSLALAEGSAPGGKSSCAREAKRAHVSMCTPQSDFRRTSLGVFDSRTVKSSSVKAIR
jgi:hypothetical protein